MLQGVTGVTRGYRELQGVKESCALFFEEFSRLLEHVLSESSASLMIAGDLNFHMENSNNALTRQFIEILETFDLKQHVLLLLMQVATP